MARPVSATPTDAERAILEVLWKKKEASVREVTDELSKKKPVAYTTVLTMFKILDKKGLVSHRTEGRAFIYSAAISRTEARRQALENLLKQFFNGSPNVLAQHLVNEHDMDVDELKALQEKVDTAAKKGAHK
ncbi:MAG TPA: BlaI/MecI/CopY family transcriptional regulator [Pseudoxanthomonas sp.]|nr:BlaI/MecI/CopY family transcriptional regulator [Pseudoxanthomonas sp.]